MTYFRIVNIFQCDISKYIALLNYIICFQEEKADNNMEPVINLLKSKTIKACSC
ncbi:uncharacterized protein ASCRUDRAFT_73912 [Ascoidea rubescens DSM 1968]|uniref:Uncharacterized protein n=1 Tax=Ascoidea rubescens DSM 1968 TaxID=1344418 RepID=A0A1D2VRN9_9ASCO|nr:hypothetical protein ASCRUDRAFT_73912 [Ascoidea rubescens DSM 1968]ODV64248.1 hypothetical protein ASCRUDRAFT_73912 [Ascoidea rubescens DSM 1968]